jgi:hypothetical protein
MKMVVVCGGGKRLKVVVMELVRVVKWLKVVVKSC